MHRRASTPIQSRREAEFTQNMGAFMRRDFAAIDRAMRADVIMELPGTSWLTGTHEGYEAVSRCIVSLRHVLDSEQTGLSFLHEGDQMIVRHDITVRGPMHEVEMSIRVRVRYDDEGKAAAFSVEPEDLALFDHVLDSLLRDEASA